MSSTLNIYIRKTCINNIMQQSHKTKNSICNSRKRKSTFRKDVRTRDVLSRYPRFNYDGEFSKRE